MTSYIEQGTDEHGVVWYIVRTLEHADGTFDPNQYGIARFITKDYAQAEARANELRKTPALTKAVASTDEDEKNAGFPVVIARGEVVMFCAEMERALRKHDKTKGELGWKRCGLWRLSNDLSREIEDLITELNTLHKRVHGDYLDCDYIDGTEWPETTDGKTSAAAIRSAAVDLANVCMMVADVLGGGLTK